MGGVSKPSTSKPPTGALILYGVRTPFKDLVGRSVVIENEINDDSNRLLHSNPASDAFVTAWPTGRRRLLIDGEVVCDYGMEAYWSIEPSQPGAGMTEGE